MPGPKPNVPGQISIPNVSPGRSASAEGGGIMHSPADVVARIDGDAFAAFFVSSLQTRELTREPDARRDRRWCGRPWQSSTAPARSPWT